MYCWRSPTRWASSTRRSTGCSRCGPTAGRRHARHGRGRPRRSPGTASPPTSRRSRGRLRRDGGGRLARRHHRQGGRAGVEAVYARLAAPRRGPGQRRCDDGLADAHALAGPGTTARARLAEHGLICLGEVGIGNTTVAAALSCVLLGLEPGSAAGLGSGIDSAMVRRKQEVVAAAVARARAVHGTRLTTLGAARQPRRAGGGPARGGRARRCANAAFPSCSTACLRRSPRCSRCVRSRPCSAYSSPASAAGSGRITRYSPNSASNRCCSSGCAQARAWVPAWRRNCFSPPCAPADHRPRHPHRRLASRLPAGPAPRSRRA